MEIVHDCAIQSFCKLSHYLTPFLVRVSYFLYTIILAGGTDKRGGLLMSRQKYFCEIRHTHAQKSKPMGALSDKSDIINGVYHTN